jgi:AmmeMemoRadiSam system protein A
MSNLKVVFMPHPPIIIPEIGGGKELEAQRTIEAMESLGQLVRDIKPDTIIFTTPHGNSFSNGTCILQGETLKGDFSTFGYPKITFEKKVNKRLSQSIFDLFEENDFVSILLDGKLANRYGVEATLDNGVMVPMYFIDKYYKDYDIVHITPGFTPLEENYSLGKIIQDIIKQENRSIILVCSGDLSHALKDEGPYSFHPSGPSFDKKMENAIRDRDPLPLITMDDNFVEEAAQCGLRSFLIGFGLLDGYKYDSKVLSYEGPFGVGYLTGCFMVHKDQKEASLLPKIGDYIMGNYQQKIADEDDYIKLARMAIEAYARYGRRLVFEEVKEVFTKEFIQKAKTQKAGTFVSIHKNGELRGCIGTISPTKDDIIQEIINNSISASGHDPRFNAVEPKELMDLDIKVDILMDPELIKSKCELDVNEYGVIVEKGHKRGLLLPNLDGVDTIEEQVRIAMDKAGISKEEGMRLYRFKVIRHEA